MNELRNAADLAGCLDTDVLKLARPDLDPRAAVQDLKARFPAAFVRKVHEMTAPELAELETRLLGPKPAAVPSAAEVGDCRAMSDVEFTRAQQKLGIRVSAADSFRARGWKV